MIQMVIKKIKLFKYQPLHQVPDLTPEGLFLGVT